MKFLKVLFFLLCVVTINVYAQTSEQLKRERDKLTADLEKLTREFNETSKNKNATLKQLNILKAQINLREKKIQNINAEVRNLNSEIAENTNTVRSLQQQLDQLRKEYKAMVLFAYYNKSGYNKLMFVFAAKDFNQAYKRLKYLQEFAAYRKRQAGYIETKQTELNGRIVQLDKTKEEKRNILLDQEKEKANLGKERSSQQKVASSLTKQETNIRTQQRQLRARIQTVSQAIIRKEIEELRKKQEAERLAAAAKAKAANKDAPAPAPVARKTDSEVLNSTPEAAALSVSFLGNKGRLPWPVANGDIIQGYGVSKVDGIEVPNRGVDIRTSAGAAVRTVFEGTVRRVQNIMGTYLVAVQHGEYFTVYSSLKSTNVAVGQKVSTKQNIAVAGTDAVTGETVINFAVYKASEDVNPETWLAR